VNILFKILLLPFAFLYGLIISLRNILYKSNFIGSTDFEIPVISIGNLSVGGTGKTPFAEMLIEILAGYQVAVLSRGYKRKSTGYVSVRSSSTSKEVGDEPLMIKLKYPHVIVSVGEQRVFAIPRLLSEHPQTQVILLDDAFQHQSVRPDINILLTTYDAPFWKDHILPLGTLREFPSGKKRANIIGVTKCPQGLTEKEQDVIIKEIGPIETQQIYFATIEYGIPYNLLNANDRIAFHIGQQELLLTGIANAQPLKDYIEKNSTEAVHFNFDDHHFFEQNELENIKKNYPQFSRWITTEKDGVRLALHKDWFIENNISLYCIPIRTKLIGRNKENFSKTIRGFLEYFYAGENIADNTEPQSLLNP
jgi:tetraacyldisaccharide 4'-kinase